MNTHKIYPVILIVIIGALLAACGGSTSAARPTATVLSINYPTAEYTGQRTVIEGSGTKLEMGSPGTLPNELPRDLPIYYPGYPTDWNISYSGSSPFFSIGLEAGSQQTLVVDWYKSNLSSSGWTIAPLDVDMGSLQCGQVKPQVIDAKKDNRLLRVSVCATSCDTYCKTTVSLFYTEKK